MEVELQIEGALLTGRGHFVDNSFDHEFGRRRLSSFVLDSFQALVWIEGNDFDISPLLSVSKLRQWQARLIETAAATKESYLEAL